MSLRALVLGLIAIAGSQTAFALDEGQWQIGAGPEATAGVDGGAIYPGGGGRIDGRYGLTDALSVWAAAGALWWSMPAHSNRVISGSAGLTLAFDVVRTVPFVSLGVAAADLRTADHQGAALGGELAVGAEYLLDPHWSLGPVARVQGYPIGARGWTVSLELRLARSF